MSNPHLTGTLYGWYWATAYEDMTVDQKWHNAQLAVNILCRHQFTHAAAAGIVGNMWAESNLSPGCWEEWTVEPNKSRGYGLVQWTGNVDHSGENPYIYWVTHDLDMGNAWENNGPLEMQRILYERDNNIEFVGSAQYPGGWLTYQNIGLVDPTREDVEYAGAMFLYDYLRPTPEEAAATVENRKALAWQVFQGTREPVPAWLLFKMSQLNRKKYRGG